jgi:TPR repeat protein
MGAILGRAAQTGRAVTKAALPALLLLCAATWAAPPAVHAQAQNQDQTQEQAPTASGEVRMETAPPFIVQRYRQAAAEGDAGAAFRLGLLHEQGLVTGAPDYAGAAGWYQQAAEAGHAPAQFKRARYFEAGLGGPADPARAVALYRAAARQGMAEAQYNLAIMLQNGHGTQRDVAAAIRWYEQAAFRGVAEAMRALGLIYLGGVNDAPQDDIEAWAWLTLAEENGDTAAASRLPEVARRLEGAAMAEARELADAYRQLRLVPAQ